MILAMAGQKGGAGKSTLAIHLAAEWHRQGRRVLLVDADSQGTALTWAEVAAEREIPAPAVIALGDNLRAQLPGLADAYEITVIDTPGRAGKRQAHALLVADLALLPCGPSTPDVWSLGPSLEVLEEIRSLRPELYAALVLNRRTRTAEGHAAREALEGTGLPVLAAEIGARVAFSEALAAGLGVTSYAPASPAAAEVQALALEIERFTQPQARALSAPRRKAR